MTSGTSTEVEIFGSVYAVRAEQGREYLQELAQRVDATMRQVAGKVNNPEPARIAILAALNIADELHQCRERHDGERVEIRERVSALAGELAAALEG